MKMRFEKKRFKKRILFFVLLSLILFGIIFVFAYGNPSEGFVITSSNFSEVNASGMCIEVDASSYSGASFFVPSATYNELMSFFNNIPSGVSSNSCINYPARIAQWTGKINQYTDPITGEWRTDPDCTSSTGYAPANVCGKFFEESADVVAYETEYIYDWKDSGCSGSTPSARTTYRCILCNEYTYDTQCYNYACQWHTYGQLCSKYTCGSYDASNCEERGCYWDSSTCYGSYQCNWITSQQECTAEYTYADGYCGWDSTNNCCYSGNDWYGCSSYGNDWDCSSQAPYCQWADYYCHPMC